MVAMISLPSGSYRAISSPTLILAASSLEAERVTGIGQKVPSAIVKLSQTPFQSALVMKLVSGLKPPMPIMIRSPFSRADTGICFRPAAFFFSASRAAPSSRQQVNPFPPWGGINFDINSSLLSCVVIIRPVHPGLNGYSTKSVFLLGNAGFVKRIQTHSNRPFCRVKGRRHPLRPDRGASSKASSL
jgi:hypothetical protein